MDAVAVLLVSSLEEDARKLESIFSHSNWKLFRVNHQDEAIQFLQINPTPVVITDCGCASDSGWAGLIGKLGEASWPCPRVIVASRLADDPLWLEVLNCGGYNVLQKPFDPREVYWVVSHAWRDWKAESARASAAPALAVAATV